MILAAGYGKRMGELTINTPKPLLQINNKPIISYLLQQLQKANVLEVIINTSKYHEQFISLLGSGSEFGLTIQYSHEGDYPLETAGGIRKALPMLGSDPFLVINGDIATDYSFEKLAKLHMDDGVNAHLVLVENPIHHSIGDFSLTEEGRVVAKGNQSYTFSGISLIKPGFIKQYDCRTLGELFKHSLGKINGEVFSGFWIDIGTPERLALARNHFQQ